MTQAQTPSIALKIAVKLCPIIAFVFSIIVIALTVYIHEKLSPVFLAFCLQVYLNWYSIYAISYKASTIKIRDMSKNIVIYKSASDNMQQNRNANYWYWYCERCRNYTYKPTQHCIFCEKCFHFRDHHCFYLGACILRQNMGNFILFCFYTILTCIYSLCVLGPYLYDNINRMITTDTGSFNILLNFCFPIALIRLLQSRDNTCVLLVTMFDTLVSVLCISMIYGIWKLHSCLTGKQRYANAMGRQTLKEIFGSYGLWNIIFPYNGLIGTRDINGKYELKEV